MSENVALGIADICGLSVLGVCYLWVFSVALYNLMKKIKNMILKKLNSLIEPLKSQYPSMYNKLHNYNLKGVGPGEATLYFLLDDGYLGGGASGGVDMTVGSTPYEIKAALVNPAKTHVSGFKLGAGVDYKRIITELMKMKDEYGI